MSQNTIRRALPILMAGALLCAPAALLGGCFGGDEAAGSSPAAAITSAISGNTTEHKANALAPYIEATNGYNGFIITFDYAITPSLEKMRSGARQTSISLPHFTDLQKGLEEARAEPGSTGVYEDIDEKADAVLAILKDLAPLSEKMNAYYSSKGYMADDYAAAAQMTAQYLPLYDAFDAAYDALDAVVTAHHREVQQAQLEDLRKDGRTNAANFLALNLKARELIEMTSADTIDKAAAEAKITEINELAAQLPDIPALGSYRSNLNRFIGTFRTYAAGSEDGIEVIDDFNDLVSASNRVYLNDLDAAKK